MKLLTTILAVAISFQSFAQGFNKKVPVELSRFDIGLYSNTDFTQDFTARKELVNNSGKLTAEQFAKAMTLANESSYPGGMNSPKEMLDREKEIRQYKAYWQGSWLRSNPTEGWAQTLHLIWLPREENQKMPDDLKPTDKDGIFFVVSNNGIYMDGLPKPGVPSPTFINDMKKKHSKAVPATIDSPRLNILSTYGVKMEFAYNELVVKGKYSDAEFTRIAELATERNWPRALSTGRYDDAATKALESVSKYKSYSIATFNDEFAKLTLYWIPKEENKHMPALMQPLTDEGFFMVSRREVKEDPYLAFKIKGATPAGRSNKAIAGKPSPNATSSAVVTTKNASTSTATTTQPPQTSSQPAAPTTQNKPNSYTTSSGIQVSTGVDMSEFTNNSRLGTMMLYYGADSKISSIYMYEIRGKSMTNKGSVAGTLNAKISTSAPFIGYEWLPGYDCRMAKEFVYKKTNSTRGTNCQGEYKIN